MKKQKPKDVLLAACQEKFGAAFDLEIFKKALAKAKRWTVNAYGAVDLQELIDESGAGAIVGFYEETLKKPDGKKTFNRGF